VTRWCIDANVIIAILLEERVTPAARAFWTEVEETDELLGPQILFPECTGVLRRKVTEAAVSEAEGLRLLDKVLSFPINIEASADQFRLALAWALAGKRTKMHDLQYVAVSQIRNAIMVTIDGGLRQAANEHGVRVRVLR
jgi:predicted nucleic acid-binding protein